MRISWDGVLNIRNAHGTLLVISSAPRNGADARYVELLGDNQGNSVSRAAFSRDRVAGFCWPLGVPLPEFPDVGAVTTHGHNPSDR
jgi:hypothetical protein